MNNREVLKLALDALEMHIHGAGSIIYSKMAWDALHAELAKSEPKPIALVSYSYCKEDDYSVSGPHLRLYHIHENGDAVFNANHYGNGIERPKPGFVVPLYRKEDL